MKSTIDPAAEIRPAVDLAKLGHLWDLACSKEERTEKTLAETRLEKGRLLVEARKAFPKTGNDGGWSRHLVHWKIERDTALRYMKLSGFVDSTSDKKTEVKIPTYAQAGIVQPRRSEQVENDDVEREPSPVRAALVVQHAPPILDMRPMPSGSPLADAITTAVKSVVSRASALQGACEDLSNLLRANKASVGGIQFGITRTNALLALSALKESLAIMEGKSNG